uniref:Uncharacterized protein n=1 Tax=Anguilla anguilla TaxID=7936 RepID=A0A0E9PPW2_ANGAN
MLCMFSLIYPVRHLMTCFPI